MNESSNRYEECADPRQCIKEDENGKCIGGYGYCLREKIFGDLKEMLVIKIIVDVHW